MVNLMRRAQGLVSGARTTPGVTSILAAGGTTDARFGFDKLTVGFVLRPLARHVAAYGSDRRRDVPLTGGVGWLMDAGVDGQCAWDGDSSFLNIQLDETLVRGVSGGRNAPMPTLYAFHDPLIVEMALAIHGADETAGRLYRDTLGRALAAHLLTRADMTEPVPATASPLDDQRLQRAVDLIEARIADSIALDELAAVAAMSPFHFSRRFKTATGQSPQQFVMSRRIDRAKIMLRTTRDPVAEIAYRVGYQDVSRFTEVFKRAVGTTPGAFRSAA